MQLLDSDLPRTSRASFDQAVWRERTKNLEAKEASAAAATAAAALANASTDSDQSSEDSPRAESVASQVHPIPAASACS